MRSLTRTLLETLVARRPRRALQASCAKLDVYAVHLRLPTTSPLFRAGGGETLELPMDDAIAPYVLEHYSWEPDVVDLICRHAPPGPAVLLDLGAHVGLVTRQLVHRLPELAAAVCFEPHPRHFPVLTRNLAHLPQCRLVQAAVSVVDGDLDFYEDSRNTGNYSLNLDAMRGREYRTTSVRCLRAAETNLLAPLPPELRDSPIVWKSDLQGMDELIVAALPDAFWSRVHTGVVELWRIERPGFDRGRLAEILAAFPVRRFTDDPERNVAVDEVLSFCAGADYADRDLFFARR